MKYTREEMLKELNNNKELVVEIGYFNNNGKEWFDKGRYQSLKGWAAEHSTQSLNEFYKTEKGFASKFIFERAYNN